MRILHTSDWHVGKRLMERVRLDEQAEVLDEIIAVCEKEEIELVLIAGDIFDTYTPGADAEELFFSKIKKVAGEHRAVLIISGNHDDGVRLSAVAPLAEEQGVYIVGNARTPIRITDKSASRHTRPVRSGKGFAVFENKGGEKVFVATLPYPNEARFKEEKSALPYIERMQGWMEESANENIDKLPSVFMAHIFVAGGAVSDGERDIDLGGARAIPASAIPKSDYIALGHLHKKQRMGENCYYSGSPLQYSFDETADKSVKVFDLNENGVKNLRDIPLTKGKKLVRLTASDVDTAEQLLVTYSGSLVELTLVLTQPLTANDSKRLAGHDNLVSLRAQLTATQEGRLESRKGMTDEELFTTYYKTLYSAEPKEELKTLFLTTLNELQER